MPLRLLLLSALLVLALAPTALAKGLTDARACGPEGCAAIPESQSHAIMGGNPADPPAADAAWFEIRATLMTGPGQEETLQLRFAPASGLLRGDDGTWMRPPAEAIAVLRQVTDGLPAFGARAPAAPARPDGGDGPPWELLVAGACVLALIAAGAAAAVAPARRRRPPAGGLTAD